jgi:hypothetical protein
MKRTIAIVITTAIFASTSALADSIFSDCQSLSPADVAALSVAQLKVRYCEAREKRDQGSVEAVVAINTNPQAFVYTMLRGTGTSRQNESAKPMVEIAQAKYASCDAAMTDIANLSAEKGTKLEIDKRPIDDKMCN